MLSTADIESCAEQLRKIAGRYEALAVDLDIEERYAESKQARRRAKELRAQADGLETVSIDLELD